MADLEAHRPRCKDYRLHRKRCPRAAVERGRQIEQTSHVERTRHVCLGAFGGAQLWLKSILVAECCLLRESLCIYCCRSSSFSSIPAEPEHNKVRNCRTLRCREL